jgi:hypothetical protein
MSGHLGFKIASEEVASDHAAFGLGHIAFAHPAFPEHLGPGHNTHAEAVEKAAHANDHYLAHQHHHIGHGIALGREQSEHVNAVAAMNALMAKGRKAKSYLDYSPFKFPAASKAANTPMLMPAHMLKAAWLDSPAPRG